MEPGPCEAGQLDDPERVDGIVSMLQRTGRIRNLPAVLAGSVVTRAGSRGGARAGTGTCGPGRPLCRHRLGDRLPRDRRFVEAPRLRERARRHAGDRPPGRPPHQRPARCGALVVEQEDACRRSGSSAHGADRPCQERRALGCLEHGGRRPVQGRPRPLPPASLRGLRRRPAASVRKILAMVGMEDAELPFVNDTRGPHLGKPQRGGQSGPAPSWRDHAAQRRPLAQRNGAAQPPAGEHAHVAAAAALRISAPPGGAAHRRATRRSSTGPPRRGHRVASSHAVSVAIFAGAAPRASPASSRRTSSIR